MVCLHESHGLCPQCKAMQNAAGKPWSKPYNRKLAMPPMSAEKGAMSGHVHERARWNSHVSQPSRSTTEGLASAQPQKR